MSINNILGNMPSLVNYMFQDDNSSDFVGYNNRQNVDITSILNAQNSAQSDAYVIDLSPEAQKMLEQDQASGSDNNTSRQNAQAHFLSFFEDSGIDLSALSGDSLELIEGLVDFIGESDTTSRDTKTDALEAKVSNGERDVYTLLGENRRMRIAIEENNAGQKILTLTDLNQNIADIAQFSIEKDDDGNTIIKLDRHQDIYENGRKAGSEERPTTTFRV